VADDSQLADDRALIHEALERAKPRAIQGLTSVLTGWVVVAEYMDADGDKWLSRFQSEGMTTWSRAGLLHEGLQGSTWDADDG
jgi:hypothetical protein